MASGGPLRPGVAKLEGVALRCKGLLRKKEAAPAFKLVQYATMLYGEIGRAAVLKHRCQAHCAHAYPATCDCSRQIAAERRRGNAARLETYRTA